MQPLTSRSFRPPVLLQQCVTHGKKLFDRQMIGLWLSKQGSICPLTGQPLVEAELRADDKAKAEAKAWSKDLLAKRKQAAAAGAGRAKEARGRGREEPGDQTGKQQQTGLSMAKASAADPAATLGRSRGGDDADRIGAGAAPSKGAASEEGRGSKEGDSNDDIYDF